VNFSMTFNVSIFNGALGLLLTVADITVPLGIYFLHSWGWI
jgi:hypothetical protein